MRCRNCDEQSTEELCDYCKENNPTRCKWCGVILQKGNVCEFCAIYPPKILDKCCKCGKSRKPDRLTFKRNGNWCGACLLKLERKLKGYQGFQPYEDWLYKQSLK